MELWVQIVITYPYCHRGRHFYVACDVEGYTEVVEYPEQRDWSPSMPPWCPEVPFSLTLHQASSAPAACAAVAAAAAPHYSYVPLSP